jgi:hypothetical protein
LNYPAELAYQLVYVVVACDGSVEDSSVRGWQGPRRDGVALSGLLGRPRKASSAPVGGPRGRKNGLGNRPGGLVPAEQPHAAGDADRRDRSEVGE